MITSFFPLEVLYWPFSLYFCSELMPSQDQDIYQQWSITYNVAHKR